MTERGMSRAGFGGHVPATPRESAGFLASRSGVTRMLARPAAAVSATFPSDKRQVDG
jgi:hypothetical protein